MVAFLGSGWPYFGSLFRILEWYFYLTTLIVEPTADVQSNQGQPPWEVVPLQISTTRSRMSGTDKVGLKPQILH